MKRLILLPLLSAGLNPAALASPAPSDTDRVEQAPAPGVVRRPRLTVDLGRLISDRAYAIEDLARLDSLASVEFNPGSRAAMDSERQAALIGAERAEEAEALGRNILASRPELVEAYRGVGFAALAMKRPLLFVEAVETAARRLVTPDQRAAFRAGFHQYMVDAAWQALAGDAAARGRLAEALRILEYGDAHALDQVGTLGDRAAETRMIGGDLAGAPARRR